LIGFLFLPAPGGLTRGATESRSDDGQGSHPAAATERHTAPVPVPPPSAKAVDYYRSGNVLWVVNQLWGLLLPSAFLFTGLSARIRDWARRLGRYWFFAVCLYFIIFFSLYSLLSLPLTYYESYVRGHAYGMSNQTFGKWLGDALKMFVLGTVVGVVLLWVPYLLIRKSPRRWWLYTWLLAVPLVFVAVLVTPVWIEPLFNDFHEMENKALEAKILALAERAGIDSRRVYQVDKSVDTKAMNAYVTGFLGTKRIVIYDTLLKRFGDREVLFVMGHEMGHYVLGHIVQGMLFSCVLILIGLFVIRSVSGPLIVRFRARFGFNELADVASLPLVLLLVQVFTLVTTPGILAFSRHIEHDADRFGLEITQDNHAAAMGFVKFEQEDLGYPRPGWLYVVWRASHPPLGERIDFCNEYRPWQKGEPLRYGGLFRRPR
jgi:Zn-dependent protease with chaperone function